MRIKWKKILSQLLWFELLAVEPIKLLVKGLHSLKTGVMRKLAIWAAKVAILLALAHCALLFFLGALALYLNDLLGSNYQGLLIVSGGGLVLFLLFWQLCRIRWPNNL
jgi:hypothetical protein